ncbi:N(4)-(beta-N-acetylglucosaminyl)-L-asparaginase-like [Saccoglossus kowalevskii]
MIILDRHGNIAVGSSTSGSPNKHVGRVGDSPLPGCGLYADNQIGAAAATGNGDEIMRFCCTFQIVQYMKQGLDVQSACQQMVTNISERIGVNNIFEVGFIAMDKQGNCGAAGTVKSWSDNATEYPGFPYVVWNEKTMPVPSIKVEPAVICSAT